MKRLLSVFLLCAMVFSLAGCHSGESNTVNFYYYRDMEHYQYFQSDGVIHAQSRDLANHRNDLRYALGLYLAGPMEEGLVKPFTRATRLLCAESADDRIYIELSDHGKSLTDAEFTLACACLTMTCMDLLPCTEVTIVSGERCITMNGDNILLFDIPQETIGG